ncbi:MAG: hypothetical protein ACOCV8_05960, partial [Spirochaetota bacterium]
DIDRNVDISPLIYESAQNYIYIADIRFINKKAVKSNVDADSFVFKQIGIVEAENEHINIIESIFKRVKSIETSEFIKSYEKIVACIDLDKDGDDEVIIKVSGIDNTSRYKIILPTKKGYLTLLE